MNSNTLTYTAANTINITPLFNFNKKQRTIGKKVYEKANHLGNVLVTLSDRKFPMKITELDYYWNFENSDDSEVNGSGLDPVTNTATYVSSAGYDGSDVIETNTGDYVEFADDARLDFGTRDFTVAVWVKKITQLNYGNAVVSKWNTGASPGTNEWILNLNGGISGTTNGPAFGVQIGTTSYSAKKATPVTNTGQWYFLVGKREGNTISIYVDGVLEDTETIPTGASINNISGRKMSIGKIYAGYYSNMQVDNLMIFDNALSDDQIAAMYAGEQYAYYEPNVLSYSDYYPFGSLLPNRHTTQTSSDYDQNNNRVYRYGFNGHEKDFEVKNITGGHYDFTGRVYDPRLGRFFSTDPWEAKYSWQTPYAYFSNSPISKVDWNGFGDGNDVKKHKVEKGDTYYKLSKQYNVTVKELKTWNKYEDTKIPVGVDLIVSNPNKVDNDNNKQETVTNSEPGTLMKATLTVDINDFIFLKKNNSQINVYYNKVLDYYPGSKKGQFIGTLQSPLFDNYNIGQQIPSAKIIQMVKERKGTGVFSYKIGYINPDKNIKFAGQVLNDIIMNTGVFGTAAIPYKNSNITQMRGAWSLNRRSATGILTWKYGIYYQDSVKLKNYPEIPILPIGEEADYMDWLNEFK